MIFKILFSVCLASAVLSQTSVPSRPTGYYLQQGSTIVLEAFYDLLCPDSKASWPVLQQLMEHFKAELTVILHLFPLPYHHDAFFATEVAQMVIAKHPTEYKSFVSLMFQHQDDMKTGAVNLTEPQVKSRMASIVGSGGLGITETEVMAGFNNSDVYETAVLAWKMAAQRSIHGTASFVVNSIFVAEAGNFKAQDWMDFINKLLNKAVP
eukprot:m.308862 g.308862  ORF g.308862 m.308862 type:complete len:209 (+) comp44967_c0_seq1:835-1461(+)